MAEEKAFENRRGLTEDILALKEDYPFMSKDMPLDGSSYFYFAVVKADQFLRERYRIEFVLKALRCSKRVIGTHLGSRSKYKKSSNFFFKKNIVAVEDIKKLEDLIIYEPNELESFLPVDVDTLEITDFVKTMRKLEDFVKLETAFEEENQVKTALKNCKKISKFNFFFSFNCKEKNS